MEVPSIQRVAVVGLGRMGHGIAQVFATAGYPVRGYDGEQSSRSSLVNRIRGNLDQFAAAALLEPQEIPTILDRLEVCGSLEEAVAQADFVVEAIAEEIDVKRQWFTEVERLVRPSTILASNSSTFTASQSAGHCLHPERVLVTHWFNPPHIVPTVEIVPSERTSEEVIRTAIELHRHVGKMPVRVNGELPGFLVNRIQVAMYREVWSLFEQGVATAEDIDAAVRGSIGFRLAACGPLATCDFGGLDIWRRVYENLIPFLRNDQELPDVFRQLLADGKLGVASGSGFHDYSPEKIDRVTRDRDATMLRLLSHNDNE